MKVTICYRCIYERSKIDYWYPYILVTMQYRKVRRVYEFAFGYGMKNSMVQIRPKKLAGAVYTIGFSTDTLMNDHERIIVLRNALQCLQDEFNGDLDMYVLHCIKKLFAKQFVTDVDAKYSEHDDAREYRSLLDQILHRSSTLTVELNELREEPE